MEENEYNRIVDNIEKEDKYELKEGILYRVKGQNKFRVIETMNTEGLMYMMHDNELSGHFGIEATLDRIRENYWWKNMKDDIEEYVKNMLELSNERKTKRKERINVNKDKRTI
ncbi:unnamed protein product [Rhizophagus irregularis]|nr:unnamed protein product [Rhizophagus irregularis]